MSTQPTIDKLDNSFKAPLSKEPIKSEEIYDVY